MAKKQSTTGEQLPLIDLAPENAKEIMAVAKKYKKAQGIRIDALAEEKAQKTILLDLVQKTKLTRLPDGKIRFRCDGLTITVTPRDKLVQVKETDE